MPRRRRAVPVLTVLTVLAVLTGGSPALAADSWTVPDRATITINGLGFGHGRGLSQYGALGRARAGHDYRKIVGFYYPGTRWGTASGAVKVLITGDTTNDVVVGPRSGLTVRSLGTGRTWTLPARRDGNAVKRWRIIPASGHRSTVGYRTGAWHVWRTVAGDAQFAAGGAPVRLYKAGGSVEYRGTLRSASASDTGMDRDTVNIVPLDSYLRGVVPQEVPALWPAAAVRAQAVAARTYAAYERADRSGRFDLYDTIKSQVYGGYSAEHPSSDAAVRVTAKRVLLSGGEPAFTQFSASNGGYSVAGAFPYLRAQQDRFDKYNPDGGRVGWETSVTDVDIEKQWPAIDNLISITIDERDGRGTWGGRVDKLTLTGSDDAHTVTVSGDTFRTRFGLRSTWFTFQIAAAG